MHAPKIQNKSEGKKSKRRERMGVFTFVCKQSGNNWSAKQLNADLESSGDSTFELQRNLVQCALAVDSSGPVQSSFSYVTPSSAVFQVVVGGSVEGGSLMAPAASGGSGADAPPAEEVEKKAESDEEEDMDFMDIFGGDD